MFFYTDSGTYIKLICLIQNFVKRQGMVFTFLMPSFHILYYFCQNSKSDLRTTSHRFVGINIKFRGRRNWRFWFFLRSFIFNNFFFRFLFLFFNAAKVKENVNKLVLFKWFLNQTLWINFSTDIWKTKLFFIETGVLYDQK